MAYYITGDCHANFEKLIWLARFNKKLGKEDVIILLGDVGLNYFGADKDRENKKILADFPNYFLCIHGNHEERPYHIQTYRTQIWRGGEVYYEPEFPHSGPAGPAGHRSAQCSTWNIFVQGVLYRSYKLLYKNNK